MITEIINAIKACFIYEDKNLGATATQNYTTIMELVCNLLMANTEGEVLMYSPELINSILELLRLDIGAESSIITKVLAVAEELVRRPKLDYFNEYGQKMRMSESDYCDLVNEILEVIDSIFVEPNKSYYMTHLQEYSRLVSSHSLWDHMAALPAPFQNIFNSAVVVLDDVITEMPENMVNGMLERLVNNKLADCLLEHYLTASKLDFEMSGFYVLFVCKYLNSPVQPVGYESKIDTFLERAFGMLIDRRFIA